MSVTPFPTARRIPIEDPAEIAEMERTLSAAAGLVAARGGLAALGGRELLAMSPGARAVLLTDMYDAGEVIFGWREAEDARARNVSIERLSVSVAGREPRAGWRAEFYREAPDEGGHRLEGAVVAGALSGIATRLIDAVNDPARIPDSGSGAALAAFAAASGATGES